MIRREARQDSGVDVVIANHKIPRGGCAGGLLGGWVPEPSCITPASDALRVVCGVIGGMYGHRTTRVNFISEGGRVPTLGTFLIDLVGGGCHCFEVGLVAFIRVQLLPPSHSLRCDRATRERWCAVAF